MTSQEAMRVLMLSPIYFKLRPLDRKQLISEYCTLFDKACQRFHKGTNNKSRIK